MESSFKKKRIHFDQTLFQSYIYWKRVRKEIDFIFRFLSLNEITVKNMNFNLNILIYNYKFI